MRIVKGGFTGAGESEALPGTATPEMMTTPGLLHSLSRESTLGICTSAAAIIDLAEDEGRGGAIETMDYTVCMVQIKSMACILPSAGVVNAGACVADQTTVIADAHCCMS